MKLCKKKNVHRENKVGSKKLHHETLLRIAKGQASVRTKGSGSVSTDTSTVQCDQVVDEILAMADMEPSLVCSTCGYSARTSLEYFNHLHHRHNLVTGLETKQVVVPSSAPHRVPFAGNRWCATQRRKSVTEKKNSAGGKPKLQQGVIEVSDISDAEGEESHICIGYDDDDRPAGGGGPVGRTSALLAAGGGGPIARTALLAAGGGDAGCEPDRYDDDDDRPAGGGRPIGRTSALLAVGGGDAGCEPDRYDDDDDRPVSGGTLSAALLRFSPAAGDGDAGCTPNRYDDDDDRPAGGDGPIDRTSEHLGVGGGDAGRD